MIAALPRAFVGLGEGIGNVLMGLPVLDALHRAGYAVEVDFDTTPGFVASELWALVSDGRPWLERARPLPRLRYDLACCAHWWLRMGNRPPPAREVRIGPRARHDMPEIEQNLSMLEGLVERDEAWGRVVVEPQALPDDPDEGGVAVHPGCKPDPEWRARKVYPRWAEVTHRLKDAGLAPSIVGTPADADIYCGEPLQDFRVPGFPLREVAVVLSGERCVVSGDSGIHHLAVAQGLPTVALFHGSSVEKARHPNPAGPAPIILQAEEGRPFESIEPREVVEAVQRAIGEGCLVRSSTREVRTVLTTKQEGRAKRNIAERGR